MPPSATLSGAALRTDDLGAAAAVRHCAATGLLSRHLGFGGWLRLNPALRAHWATVDRAAQMLQGRISGRATPAGRVVAWLARLVGCPFGPVNCDDVPVTVRIRLGTDRLQLHWRRSYAMPGRRPLVVRSAMYALPDGRFAEVFPGGLGVTLALDEAEGGLRFTSTGFVWRVLGRHVSIPRWLGPGRLSVVESCDADGAHAMALTLTHPWFGTIYRLSGTYRAVAGTVLQPDAIDVGWPPEAGRSDDGGRGASLLRPQISVSTETPDQ